MTLIVGAGIAGLSLGWRLVSAGHPVTVIEAGRVGQGASHAAAGYLQPALADNATSRMEWTSLKATPAFIAGVEAASGIDVDFRTDGMMRVAYADSEATLLADRTRFEEVGFDVTLMDGPDARRKEPALSPDIAAALHLHDITWVDGRKLCGALATAITRKGGQVLEQTRAEALHHDGETVRGIATSRGLFENDCIVLASGWRTDDIRDLPTALPRSEGVRGVILTLQDDPDQPLLRHLIKLPDGLLCPRADGRLLAGVIRDPGGTSRQADAGSVAHILSQVIRAVPATADLALLETNVGFRPYLAQSEAYHAGPVGAVSGLYAALGYGSDGYLRAAALSQHLADMILQANHERCAVQ